ncbi:MAG: hypothetical protein H6819_09060 [Phycisphaerales bacterium]|nr:hypothetical protein [Phycisphaerales bacterium]MCB9856023.1 hypothetical protein [Phycisphaerales bacterium]
MCAESAVLFDETAADRLIRAFDAAALDPAAFHHVDHVKLTWALLRRMPPDAAIGHLRDGLKRFVASLGKADRYHETITVFFALKIHDRMGDNESWEAFAERNPDLLGASREFLARYYREPTLSSDRARLAYVSPDIRGD